jgi:hypothetical protein
VAIIQVHVGKNIIENVLIDGGSKVNIIIVNLRIQLGFPKPNPAPYNLLMANQTITKQLGLIKDLKIFVHGIPYTITFIVINSSVINSIYLMLLKCPWLRDAKIFHDWGTNIVTILKTRIVRNIYVTKKLGAQTKRPKALVCYDFHFGNII